MRRNKAAKRTKKRPSLNKGMNVQKMEQAMLSAPAKMALQLNKEITVLRKKESKLKNATNKMSAKVKKSESRIKSANKSNLTTMGKKQLKKAKLAHQDNIETQGNLEKQLVTIMQALSAANQHQAKLAALRKHLTQFEKDWTAQRKQNQAKTLSKPKKKVVKRKMAKTSAAKPAHAESYQTMVHSTEKEQHEQATELTS